MPVVTMKQMREESEAEETERNDEQDSDTDRSSDDDSSSSAEGSDSEESSELDEEECERRRGLFLTDLNDLERQFSLLREQLYRERVTQVEAKLEEVRGGGASEYLNPLDDLKNNHKIRLEVCHILYKLRKQAVITKHDAETMASQQNCENEKTMLWDSIHGDLEEKIRHLEEDRNSLDVTSEVWADQNLNKKQKRKRQGSNSSGEQRRRKPVTVAGPYIVYMLKECDIIEDWTIIKKALTASKRKTKFGKISSSPRHLPEAFSL